MPKITVLMPVYNGENFISHAIDSILGQSFTDFELLIINDGSTDRSLNIIGDYKDPRIKVISFETNRGLVEALNKGISLSTAEYIARMDCDDICMPNRLEKQVDFMDACKDIGVCGTARYITGMKSAWKSPINPDEIKCRLLFNNCIAHPTVMIRRSLIEDNNLFCEPWAKHAEDYLLWVRLSGITKISSIEEALLHYRLHNNQVSIKNLKEQSDTANSIRLLQLRDLNIDPTTEEFNVHLSICEGNYNGSDSFKKWISKLLTKNFETGRYSPDILEKIINEYIEQSHIQ